MKLTLASKIAMLPNTLTTVKFIHSHITLFNGGISI